MFHLLLYKLWKGGREMEENILGSIKIGSSIPTMNGKDSDMWTPREESQLKQEDKTKKTKQNTTHTKERE